MSRRGIYPGSFNPPTIAHLAISEAAAAQFELDVVVWSLSSTALGKEHVEHPRFSDRMTVVERAVARSTFLDFQVTDIQLLVDLAAGFDVLIMGADKWQQVNEPHWYGGIQERDAMLKRLPQLAIAERHPFEVPEHARLDLPASVTGEISSTAARTGEAWQMLPEAREFAERTGAWIDLERYNREAS